MKSPMKAKKPRYGESTEEIMDDGTVVVSHNNSTELFLKELKDPEPVKVDDQPSRWASMGDAIKAAQWDLIYPNQNPEYLYGKRNIWIVTDEELLEALPPDIAYPIEYSSRTAHRDMQPFFAGAMGALSIVVCNRFAVIPSNKIALPNEERNELAAYEENLRQHEIIQPCFVWIILIAEMSVGKSTGFNLFLKHVQRVQQHELADYIEALNAYEKAKQSENTGKDKETGADTGAAQIKPFKTVFMDASPTEAALVYHLQYNPRGIALYKDEIASLVDSVGMYAKNGDKSFLDLLLSAYDGQGVSALRKPDKEGGDASMSVTQASIPIVGGIQPQRLEQLVKSDDQSGFATRLCVTRAYAKTETADFLTAEQICSDDSAKAEEMKAINNRLEYKISHLLSLRMIDECRYPRDFEEDPGLAKLKPSLYCRPRHLYLSTEALVEYVNFRKYLRVSIQNSQFGKEEMPFVDRDCGRILRIAGMLHAWQHCEAMTEMYGEFKPRRTTAREIADKPISLKTLQRAIIIVLFTMQTRRAEFPRFQKKEDKKDLQLAERVIRQITEEKRFEDWIPFDDLQIMLFKRFPEIEKWSAKALGAFLKNTLKISPEPKRVSIAGQSKPVQKTCYRLADAVANWQARSAAPESSDNDTVGCIVGRSVSDVNDSDR